MPRITGREGVQLRLKGMVGPEMVERVGATLYWGAQQIQTEAQHLITQGAVSGKNHVPSLPGEPPNNDTGVLKSHIEAVRTAPLRAEVSSNAPYAAALEFGTSKMAERPYMRPATNAKRKEIALEVSKAVNRATKRR